MVVIITMPVENKGMRTPKKWSRQDVTVEGSDKKPIRWAADLRAPAKPTLAAATNSANEPDKPKHVCDNQEQEEKGKADGEGVGLGRIEVMC